MAKHDRSTNIGLGLTVESPMGALLSGDHIASKQPTALKAESPSPSPVKLPPLNMTREEMESKLLRIIETATKSPLHLLKIMASGDVKLTQRCKHCGCPTDAEGNHAWKAYGDELAAVIAANNEAN